MQYVHGVLGRHRSGGSILAAQGVVTILLPTIRPWAAGYLKDFSPSGSVAKGTAVIGSSDIDVLISLDHTLNMSLKDIYESLFRKLTETGYQPRRQNVSLGLSLNGLKVDVVAARRQDAWSNEHGIWSHKMQSHRQTNVHEHVRIVAGSGRVDEIKLMKIWRNVHGLDFPSFPLEVTTIKALSGHGRLDTAANFRHVLTYVRDSLPSARIIDPTKLSNILSDELTVQEKARLSSAAASSLREPNWGQVVW